MRVISNANNTFVPGAEKRKKPRNRAFKFATILFSHGKVQRRCIIRDINRTGAKLEMNDTAGIPNHFAVSTDDGKSAYVRVMWRTKEEMGIRFIKRPD